MHKAQPNTQQKIVNIKKNSKNVLVANDMVSKIVDNMQSYICSGTLEIPLQQISLPIVKKIQKSQALDTGRKMGQILQKKQQIKKQLNKLDEEIQNIKQAKLNMSRVGEHKNSKYFRSELTPQDINTLKKLKLQQSRFHKELMDKTQQYQQRLKKFRSQEQQAKEKERKQKFQLKKQEIQKSLELIQKRKQQRQARKQQQRKAFKEIKNRKKIHQQWEQKWKVIEQQQQKKKQQLKEQIRKLRKISFQQIKQHQKKYQDTIKNYKQSRLRNSITFLNLEKSNVHQYRSIFFQQIEEEQKKQKQLQQMKKNNQKQFLSKIKQYNQKVKINHKPKIKPKQQKADEKQNQLEIKSLNVFQVHKKGNQYMKQVNNQMLQALKKRETKSSSAIKQQEKTNKKYKNYLKQLRKPQSEHKQNKKSQLTQIRQVFQQQTLTQEQKFYKAKMLAQKYQSRKLLRSPKSLVQSINSKIQILKQIDF